MSKLGCAGLVFVEPGTKVGGAYYHDVVLCKPLLPVICHFAADCCTLQQEELFRRETPDFIAPNLWSCQQSGPQPCRLPNLGVLQERVYHQRIRDVDELKRRLIDGSSGGSKVCKQGARSSAAGVRREGVECGEGVSPSGEGAVPLPREFF